MKKLSIFLVLLFWGTITLAQQYHTAIGIPYFTLVNLVKNDASVAKYGCDVASDGTKNLIVTYKNEQISSYAFDESKHCVFYLIIMPDTSGQAVTVAEYDKLYTRNTNELRWIDHGTTGDVAIKIKQTVDKRKFVIFVMPSHYEVHVDALISNYIK